MTPILRVARASADFDGIRRFYCDGLGLSVLADFQDHDGFDGLILGHAAAPWHPEFTRHPDHPALPPPGPESLLVLYLPDDADWSAAADRMETEGFDPVRPLNPYWDRRGRTYTDPEGWRVILQHADWTL